MAGRALPTYSSCGPPLKNDTRMEIHTVKEAAERSSELAPYRGVLSASDITGAPLARQSWGCL